MNQMITILQNYHKIIFPFKELKVNSCKMINSSDKIILRASNNFTNKKIVKLIKINKLLKMNLTNSKKVNKIGLLRLLNMNKEIKITIRVKKIFTETMYSSLIKNQNKK